MPTIGIIAKPVLSSVSIPKTIEIDRKEMEIPSIAFGKKAWGIHFGDVGIELPLPSNIQSILNSPCPIWSNFFKKKKVEGTHMLTLIPTKVNGHPLTINSLGKLIKKGFPNAKESGYRNIWEEIVKQI